MEASLGFRKSLLAIPMRLMGVFVCNREVFDLLWEQDCSFEYDVLPKFATEGHLKANLHEGSWQPVDNILDLERLDEGLSQGDYPWFRKE
jgi:NDP-sugar pyrophosphorylase family protein